MSFNTIQDDTELKLDNVAYFNAVGFNTIQDDTELKPQINSVS